MSDEDGTLADFGDAVKGSVDLFVGRYLENLNRVKRIVAIYNELVHAAGGKPLPTHGDLLRSSVVFMHAALEEFLRQLALAFLPTASPHVLDEIPLAGSVPGKRNERFSLGRLCQHRNKLVDDVISESIHEYLEIQTTTVQKTLCGCCRWLGSVRTRLGVFFRIFRQ